MSDANTTNSTAAVEKQVENLKVSGDAGSAAASQKKNWADLSESDTTDQDDGEGKLETGLVYFENQLDVAVQQADPNNPIGSVKTFEELGLEKELIDGLYKEMKFTKPSKIQEKALPFIWEGKNLIAQAQSGTGKTAAFTLACLHFCDANVEARRL